MNNLTKTISTALLSLGLLFSASIASAAFVNMVPYSSTSPSGNPSGDMYLVDNAAAYITNAPAPVEAYLFDNATPSAIDGTHLQFALDTYGSSYEVINFTSSGDDVFPGLTLDAGGKSGTYDASPLSFTGFMMKAGNLTFVALFDSAIQSLSWNTSWTGDFLGGSDHALSHMAVINAVPIPAAAFLFAPALLGFMGLRRKAKNSVA